MAGEIANEKQGTNYSVNVSVLRSTTNPSAKYGTGANYIRQVSEAGGGGSGDGFDDSFNNGFG